MKNPLLFDKELSKPIAQTNSIGLPNFFTRYLIAKTKNSASTLFHPFNKCRARQRTSRNLSEPGRQVFSIPVFDIAANPNLEQNEAYK